MLIATVALALSFVAQAPNTSPLQQPNPTGSAPSAEELWDAARAGDVARVATTLEKGAAIDAKGRYGVTALMFAADKGHLEVVKLLLEKGADPNLQDRFYQMRAVNLAISEQSLAGCKTAGGARLQRRARPLDGRNSPVRR